MTEKARLCETIRVNLQSLRRSWPAAAATGAVREAKNVVDDDLQKYATKK
jgi:hypothetical protein